MLPGWGFQLPSITIAPPHLRRTVPHDRSDHFRTAVATDHMQNTLRSTKDPFPGFGTIDPVAGFIAMDHLAMTDSILDLLHLAHGPFPGPFHDLIDPTLTDLYLMQVEHGLLCAYIAHVLFLTVVHHHRFQPAPKPAAHFQSSGRFFNLRRIAFRTGRGILANFYHLRRCLGQLSDLVHINQATCFAAQVGVTLAT